MTEHPVAQRSDCTAAHPAVQKKKKKGNSKKLGVVGMGGGRSLEQNTVFIHWRGRTRSDRQQGGGARNEKKSSHLSLNVG